MIFNYKLDKDDFLTYQLYIASISESIKKKRKRSKIIVPLLYIALGVLLLYTENITLTVISIIFGIMWYFIYPVWERQYYIKHYKSYIAENYKDRFDRLLSLEITNEMIIAKDNGSESKISTTEIAEIVEITPAIFFRLKGGLSLVLPKKAISNINTVTNKLKELAEMLKINYHLNEKWKWK